MIFLLKSVFFSDKNIEIFNNSLSKMYVTDILNHESTNTAYNVFIKRYLEIFEKAFPKKKIKKSFKSKFKNPWYTEELSVLNIKKETLYMNHIKNKGNVGLKSEYIRCRNEYFRKVKFTKKDFFQKHLLKVKNDIKATWNVINSVLGRSKCTQLFKLSIDGREVRSEKEVANEFNDYFSKVAQNLLTSIPKAKSKKHFSDYLGARNPKSIFLKFTNPIEIYKILKSMKPKFSCGWDDIPQKNYKNQSF